MSNPIFIQTLITGSTALPAPPAGAAVAGVNWAYVEQTANYTALATDKIINCTSGTFTLSLPTAVGIPGRGYRIKNSGVGVITVASFGAELIDGIATFKLVSGGAVNVVGTGAGWIIV